MNEKGIIVLVVGSAPRTGTTMYAKSVAQCLAKELDEPVLLLSVNGRSREIRPELFRELCLEEAGVEYLNYRGYYEQYDEIRERYPVCIIDGGSGTDPDLYQSSDLVFLVTDQYESSIKRAEEKIRINEDEGFATPRNTSVVINRVLPEDPHDTRYLKNLFIGYKIIRVPESSRGREAEWEGLTLFELGVRSYEKAVEQGTELILEKTDEK